MNILDFFHFNLTEEMDFDIIPCVYQSGTINRGDLIIKTFTFRSESNTQYTVYINETHESNHLLSDNTYLQDINNQRPIPTIYFSETSRGLNPLTFGSLTNKNEFMDVMGKVIFIIKDFMTTNKQYVVFSIGEVGEKKFKFYKNWLKKLPISNLLIGRSDFYFDEIGNKTNAYYLIR